MSHHHLYPITRPQPPSQPHPHSHPSSHPSSLHQPLSQPQQLPPQSPQSAPGTSRFETNSFSSKAISYEQPSYYILQYPNNDLSCSLRANNMYHNLSSTNDQITIHQSPHDSQHLSVNIAVNNPTTTLMARDTMATIATTAQTISTNHMNPTHLQTISTPATSSFSSTNGSTGPSIAFLGSTSILPGRLAPSMFQALSSSSPLSAATSSSVIVNSIINPELPQGLSPVPGPAPVAVATPVSVENLTSLSTASPSNLPNEIASLSSTTFSISTQVDFSPIINNNSHSRSPSTLGSPLTVNHHQQQSNVATISPLVTSRNNRFNSKSVSCSTDPEPRRSHHHHHHNHHQQQQNTNSQQSTPLSQSAITITPFNGNYTYVNNICNTSASVTNSISSQTNNYGKDTNYSVNNLNGGSNSSRHQTAITSTYNNFLKDASVNTSKNGKDSPTINITRKNQRKPSESSNNHISAIGKQRTITNRANKYPQLSSLAPSSSPAPTQMPTVSTPSMTTTATNTSSSISTLPSDVSNISLISGTNSSSSSSSIPSSGHHQQLVTTSTNTNHVNNNKKVISISNNNHVNGQLPSTKKRPNKSNKTLIDSNMVHGESSTTSSSSSTTTNIAPITDQISGSRKTGKKRLFHGWSWRGNPSKKPVFIKPDEPPQLRDCYPAICHIQGDVIKVRDSVLLRGGPRKTDLHFVAKICALWEAPETGEMMMSLLWYYRPEHTEPGRKPHDQLDEIFASKHQDVNSVACIDDKCYVLTFNEYCRYRKRQKMDAENIGLSLTDTFVPTGKDYNRRSRLPMRKVFPDRVFFCRKVYDFRLGRTLKNPVPPVINNDMSAWRR